MAKILIEEKHLVTLVQYESAWSPGSMLRQDVDMMLENIRAKAEELNAKRSSLPVMITILVSQEVEVDEVPDRG